MKSFVGVIEARNDPEYLGRCKVRILELHTSDKSVLPTDDLPWAWPMQPITSAGVSGIGQTPLGPVEGTWVVCIFRDEDYQYPIMIGTLGGIPLSKSNKVTESEAANQDTVIQSNTVSTGSGGTLVDSSGTPVIAETSPTDDSSIPTTPPPGSVSGANKSKAEAGIKAIIAACKVNGITHRNAIASILGIAGGESGWVPTDEGYVYSAGRFKQIYPNLTPAQVDKWCDANKKGITRKEFFSFMYGTSDSAYNGGKNGRGLGNKSDADGGEFYGRGFIQITGRPNYEKYAPEAVNNGSLLNSDLNIGANATARYFKDRCKAPQDSNGYFDAAIKSVGHNSPDIAAKKRSYYEYFLGGEQPKTPVAPLPAPPAPQPAPVQQKRDDTTGFQDPTGVYPKYIKEADTNRLARKQKLSETIYQKKKDGLEKDVPVANSDVKWNQIRVPYNASYPFNHVLESESGHVIEIDDTPKYERLHIFHTSGSFIEIDSEGNEVVNLAGAQQTIVDKDNLTCIRGASHIFIGGDGSILVGGKVNIQVGGDASIKVAGNSYTEVEGAIHMKSGGDFNILSGGAVNVRAGGNVNLDASGNANLKGGGTANVQAGGSANIKAGGTANIAGSKVNLNSGGAGSAGSADSAASVPSYSPEITMPEAITIEENQMVENMEDDPDRRDQLFKDSNPAGVVAAESNTEEPAPQKEKESGECDFSAGLNMETQLTPNFKLKDLCFSQGLPFPFGGGQNGLTDKEIACNLKHLCINILEPLKAKYSDIGFKLNSAYRNGTGTSQHQRGEAADISFSTIRGVGSYESQLDKFYQKAIEIRDSGLPYDQLIFECDPGKGYVWIHVSFTQGASKVAPNLKVCTYAGKAGSAGVPGASPSGYVPGLHKIVSGKVST